MKNSKTILFGLFVTAVALSALATPAMAQFVHPRGIMMDVYPQQVVVFWNGPGRVQRDLMVIILPPWYFVEDLMGFDSVTLTIRLASDCYLCWHSGDALKLAGADADGQVVVRWSNLTMAEEDNGAVLFYTVTFIIGAGTGTGYYTLYLTAEALADEATFVGRDQVHVSVYPGVGFFGQ